MPCFVPTGLGLQTPSGPVDIAAGRTQMMIYALAAYHMMSAVFDAVLQAGGFCARSALARGGAPNGLTTRPAGQRARQLGAPSKTHPQPPGWCCRTLPYTSSN